MKFDKVWYNGENVVLSYREPLDAGGQGERVDHGTDPAPAFKAALQSFASYVSWIHGWPKETVDRIVVRSVSIKRPDKMPRGINVCALLKCSEARNSTSTINTPFLGEPPEGYNGDRKGFLPETTVQLIDDLEAHATEYQNGERGEQVSMDLKDSANTKEFDKRAAAAEGATTRKPRAKKNQPRQADTGVAIIANPDATDPLDDDGLRQLLLSVDRDVPSDAIARWTSSDRSLAERWGRMRQKEMLDTLKDATVPVEPECVIASATLPLNAEAWTEPAPVKLTDNQVQEIAAAKERDVADATPE